MDLTDIVMAKSLSSGSGASYTAGNGINISENTISAKVDNDTIVIDENGKLKSGVERNTYLPIPLTPYSQTEQEIGKWRTKTMEMFMADILADPSAVKGMAYLSTVGTVTGDHDFYNSDIMPTCCELKVEIMQVETSGETGIHKIVNLTATSTNNSPYIWTRSMDGGTSPWGTNLYYWKSALPPCPIDKPNGTYVLKATVNNGTISYSWEA